VTMDEEKDVTIHLLNRKISRLEAENAKYRNYRDIARKYEFRITGVLLLVIGAIVSVVAYPSYSASSVASLLLMVGVTSMFVGTVIVFINTEPFINQRVAEDLNVSSVIVLDNLLRDLRLRNKGVYIPSSKAGGVTKIFIPLKRAYELPPEAKMKQDRAFVVGLPKPAQEGVLLLPLGYHLYRYTIEELKVAWKDESRAGAADAQPIGIRSHEKSFGDKLRTVFVKGLEIADRVNVTECDGGLRVRLSDSPFAAMCQRLFEEAPQVCEQIGCPLCSLVACIYTERTDAEIIIESAQSDGNDITVVCKAR
jgi:hypothetical protein